MRFRTKWVVLWSLWAARLVRQPTPPLRVGSGWLRGSVAPDGSHAQYLAIPYATVQERYQAPGPEPKWDGVFEAIEDNVRCFQSWSFGSKVYPSGQEDCLIVNVYTPLNTRLDKPLPVMVFIHGGAFFRRSSSRFMYGPEFLTSKDVVLVTLNYRLNALGFLCLGIKEAPGNVGLKDQVAALKWVQRNIRMFSGDPDNVTLFGESAGAASVAFHVLSPMSTGLFHKAIVQSGSSLAGWAFRYDPINLASIRAKEMGFISKDPHELYKFYMSKSPSELVLAKIPREEGAALVLMEMFSPCAENNIDGEDQFLTDLPYNILIRGNYNKVPMIIGANTEEGLLFAGFDDEIEQLDIEKSLPRDLEFPSNETRKAVAEKVKRMYLDDNKISASTLAKLSKLYGEPINNYGLIEETNLIMKTSDRPIWHYLFGYEGRRNILKWISGWKFENVPYGAAHADELFYLFNQEIIPLMSETDMIDKMTTMWTNFAKYGDPTPATTDLLPLKWPQVKPDDQRALYIDKEIKTVPLWYPDSMLFWRDLYSKYRRKFHKNM